MHTLVTYLPIFTQKKVCDLFFTLVSKTTKACYKLKIYH